MHKISLYGYEIIQALRVLCVTFHNSNHHLRNIHHVPGTVLVLCIYIIMFIIYKCLYCSAETIITLMFGSCHSFAPIQASRY